MNLFVCIELEPQGLGYGHTPFFGGRSQKTEAYMVPNLNQIENSEFDN